MNKCAAYCAVMLGCVSSAYAQIDGSVLRSAYGAPLDRETFLVRPGIEMVVDYGPNKQVCRIQLPSGMRIVGVIPANAITERQIDDVLDEVVPPSMRGAELIRGVSVMSLASSHFTDYEHVTISEAKEGPVGKGITVRFKDPACAGVIARPLG